MPGKASITKPLPISIDLAYLIRPLLTFTMGIVYQELGEKEKAVMDFRRCLELNAGAEWREKAEKRLQELGGLL